jgi:UDP-N-acetylglucosamine 2-epimerase
VIDINTAQNCTIDVKFIEKRGRGVGNFKSYKGKRITNPNKASSPHLDIKRKIQLCAWHPKENTFAVALHNLIFIYTEKRSPLVYPPHLRNNYEQQET